MGYCLHLMYSFANLVDEAINIVHPSVAYTVHTGEISTIAEPVKFNTRALEHLG